MKSCQVSRSRCRGGCIGEILSFGLSAEDDQPVCLRRAFSRVLGGFDLADYKPVVDSRIR